MTHYRFLECGVYIVTAIIMQFAYIYVGLGRKVIENIELFDLFLCNAKYSWEFEMESRRLAFKTFNHIHQIHFFT